MRVGVDVGGTYTDLVIIDAGRILTRKIPSTPADPSQAVLQGVKEAQIELANVSLFAHGTTIATNAVIQRKGARTGLLTTFGFRDVLQIRRTTRGKLYDFQWDPPHELVSRELRREVNERMLATGEILVPADLGQAVEETRSLLDAGIESLAICFINSYVNPANERAVRDAVLAAFPGLPTFASSDLLPEWREFERTSTAVVSAYVAPIVDTYVRNLSRSLADGGYDADLMIMSSNGGLATADACIESPAHTLLSGPSAGVMAQVALLHRAGIEDAIGMDIGGTSTDVSIIHRGQPRFRSEFELEFGTSVSFPVIDINTIGAGGGTIAWVDPVGMLHVGPQSAGASPGPACLQQGGTEATLTDANVVLHRLNPEWLLGGRVAVSEEAARHAVAKNVEALGLSVNELAEGIITLAVSNIVLAIRQLTVERGLDPREFTLVSYGGAGPLLATSVAEELEVGRILVPRFPGLTSALGLHYSDIRHDFVTTYLRAGRDSNVSEFVSAFNALAARGLERLRREGVPPGRTSVLYSADLRYEGQTHELSVLLPEGLEEAHRDLAVLLRAAHLREFGHAPDVDEPLEIVNLRVACLGLIDRPEILAVEIQPDARPTADRDILFSGKWISTPVYSRDDLGGGAQLTGPCVIEQPDTTTIVPEGWTLEVDETGNLMLTG